MAKFIVNSVPQKESYQDLDASGCNNGGQARCRGIAIDTNFDNNGFGVRMVNERPVDEEPYDPEIDSPSSWTTAKSSKCQEWCESCSCRLSKIDSPRAASFAHTTSNAILILLTLTGIVCGIFGMTGTLSLDKHGGNDTSIGSLIIFGAVVGGSISLMLVNASWSYRSTYKHENNLQTSPWCACFPCCCPTAQLAGTLIVILVCAILVTTYKEDTLAILIILGTALLLSVMVNLPLLFKYRIEEELVEDEEGRDKLPM